MPLRKLCLGIIVFLTAFLSAEINSGLLSLSDTLQSNIEIETEICRPSSKVLKLTVAASSLHHSSHDSKEFSLTEFSLKSYLPRPATINFLISGAKRAKDLTTLT